MTRGPLASLVAGALVLSGCASTAPLPSDAAPVVALMSKRLDLAHDVAWAKWANGLPVRDPEREEAVLNRTIRQAEAADLSAAAAAFFMRAQIEASCLQQEYWMNVWKDGRGLPPGEPPTLASLRTRLDSTTSLLIAEWAATAGLTIPRQAVTSRLVADGISPAAAAAAAAGFPK